MHADFWSWLWYPTKPNRNPNVAHKDDCNTHTYTHKCAYTHTHTWTEEDLGRGHVNRYYDDDHLLTTVLIRDECVCVRDVWRDFPRVYLACVCLRVCVSVWLSVFLGELHCYMAVRRRFNTYPVRRSCGVEGGVQGELASLNELPSDAHWRFLTACSRFNVERLRLGLIVCKSINSGYHAISKIDSDRYFNLHWNRVRAVRANQCCEIDRTGLGPQRRGTHR